jgi:peroxiredoxin
VAESFGLVFSLPEVLRPIYKNLDIDIPEYNGENTFNLPMPATYIINQQGKVLYNFVDADHTKRMEPSDIITLLINTKS